MNNNYSILFRIVGYKKLKFKDNYLYNLYQMLSNKTKHLLEYKNLIII